jgi:hypothetical protein
VKSSGGESVNDHGTSLVFGVTSAIACSTRSIVSSYYHRGCVQSLMK